MRNLIKPKIKGPLDAALDQFLPLAIESRCCMSSYLSQTRRRKKSVPVRVFDAHCVVISLAENIPLEPVSCLKSPVCSQCMAHPSISTADSYWWSGGEVMGRAPISHISLLQRRENIPGLQRWTHSLTPSAPTLSLLHCELVTHTHTYAQAGGLSDS